MKMNNFAVRRLENKAANGQMSVQENSKPASYHGIATKTLLFGIITMVVAIVSYFIMHSALYTGDVATLSVLLVVATAAAVPMFIVSLIIAFAPSSVKVCGFIYTVLQGLLLGTVVCLVDLVYPGLAFVAVLGTLIVFVVAVLLNKALEVRVSSKFMRGVVIAFVSLMIVSAVMGIIYVFEPSFFGVYWWLEIIISLVCIVLATTMLMSDLQSAESIVKGGVDSKYEWNVSFAIVTTLIYIYWEVLELLIRLAVLFGNRD